MVTLLLWKLRRVINGYERARFAIFYEVVDRILITFRSKGEERDRLKKQTQSRRTITSNNDVRSRV